MRSFRQTQYNLSINIIFTTLHATQLFIQHHHLGIYLLVDEEEEKNTSDKAREDGWRETYAFVMHSTQYLSMQDGEKERNNVNL